jgi:hypothetical protein
LLLKKTFRFYNLVLHNNKALLYFFPPNPPAALFLAPRLFKCLWNTSIKIGEAFEDMMLRIIAGAALISTIVGVLKDGIHHVSNFN